MNDDTEIDVKINIARESPEATIHYITKYLTKGSKTAEVSQVILEGFHLVGSWKLERARVPKLLLCDCGNLGKMIVLQGVDINAYLAYWKGASGPPPAI